MQTLENLLKYKLLPDGGLVVRSLAVRVDKHPLDYLVDLLVEKVPGGPEHPARHLAEGVARERLPVGNVGASLKSHEVILEYTRANL